MLFLRKCVEQQPRIITPESCEYEVVSVATSIITLNINYTLSL